MTTRFAYDARYDPPAPVLPLRVSRPGSGNAVVLPALVDTGADCSLVPESIATSLDLPQVDRIALEGVGGGRSPATPVVAAAVEFAGTRRTARLATLGDEAIIGRDLLDVLVLRLDGVRRVLDARAPRRRQRR